MSASRQIKFRQARRFPTLFETNPRVSFLSLTKQDTIDQIITSLQTEIAKQKKLFNQLIEIMLRHLIVTWDMQDKDHLQAVREYAIKQAANLLKNFFDKNKISLHIEDCKKIAGSLLQDIISNDNDQLSENNALMEDIVLTIEKTKLGSTWRYTIHQENYHEQKSIIKDTLKHIKVDGESLSHAKRKLILEDLMKKPLRSQLYEMAKMMKENGEALDDGSMTFSQSNLRIQNFSHEVHANHEHEDVRIAIGAAMAKSFITHISTSFIFILTAYRLNIPVAPAIALSVFMLIVLILKAFKIGKLENLMRPISPSNFAINSLDERFIDLLSSQLNLGISNLTQFAETEKPKKLQSRRSAGSRPVYELDTGDAPEIEENKTPQKNKKPYAKSDAAEKEKKDSKLAKDKEEKNSEDKETKKITKADANCITWEYESRAITYNPKYYFLTKNPSIRERIVELWTVNLGLSKYNKKYYLYFNYNEYRQACAAGTKDKDAGQFYNEFFNTFAIGHIVPEEKHSGFVRSHAEEGAKDAVFKAKSKHALSGAYRFYIFPLAKVQKPNGQPAELLGRPKLLKTH